MSVIRPKEERIAVIDKKIEYHKSAIATLEERKHRILNPKPAGRRKKGVARMIKDGKLTDEETANAFGLTVDEMRDKLAAAVEKKTAE